jgi:hypothetical protein
MKKGEEGGGEREGRNETTERKEGRWERKGRRE